MPPRKTSRRPAARSRGRGRPAAGTSLQASNASYYSNASQKTVHVGSVQAGRQGRGRQSVYRVQNASGQRLEGRLPVRAYHRIVLAEFVATVLIIAAAPVVVPEKQSASADAGEITVSFAGPLVRLTAVCVLFLILALMASGDKAGKVASAFGGLVLAGTVINATDMWGALGKALGAATTAKKTGPAPPPVTEV